MKKIFRLWAFFCAGVVSALVVIFLGYQGLLWVALDFQPGYKEIDSCLDGGGAWNVEQKICTKAS